MGTEPEQPDDESAFPIVNHLAAAKSHAQRADILLRLSDTVLLAYPMQLADACERLGFVDGQCFIACRSALLCMTRDAHGLLPERPAAELETLRQALSRIAAGL